MAGNPVSGGRRAAQDLDAADTGAVPRSGGGAPGVGPDSPVSARRPQTTPPIGRREVAWTAKMRFEFREGTPDLSQRFPRHTEVPAFSITYGIETMSE